MCTPFRARSEKSCLHVCRVRGEVNAGLLFSIQFEVGFGVAAAEIAVAVGVEMGFVTLVLEAVGIDEGGMRHFRWEIAVSSVDLSFEFAPRAAGELTQLADDEGHVGGGEFDAEAGDESVELGFVTGGEFAIGVGFALMPENAFEGAGLQREFRPAQRIVPRVALRRLVVEARLPRVDGRAPDGAGDEADGHARSGLGDGVGEGATEPDADCGGLVEVQRVHGRHPCAGLGEHEHTRVREVVGGCDNAASGHVGLADEEEEVKRFLGGQGGGLGARERREQAERDEEETKRAHGEAV